MSGHLKQPISVVHSIKIICFISVIDAQFNEILDFKYSDSKIMKLNFIC